MKKSLKSLVFLGIALTLCLTSVSAEKLKGKKAKMKTGTPEVIDYQGQALGSAIPDWVVAIGDGSQKRVKKSLGITNKETAFILQNKGNDLDFLKTWTDQVDVRAEVASSIEQTIAQTVQSELEGKEVDKQTKARAIKIYSSSMTNLTVNGLTKEASYWIETRTPKPGVKKAKKVEDYNYEYTYFVVYSINTKLYESQLKAAMDNVEDNDDQTQFLKDVLTQKLLSTITMPEQQTISYNLVETEEVSEDTAEETEEYQFN